MLEQKLFFTRNGEYTLWEKLDFNNKDNLLRIKEELEDSFNIKLDNNRDNLINDIYLFYLNQKLIKDKEKIEKIIDRFFISENLEKLDFNALLFKFDNRYLDLKLIETKLNSLDIIAKSYEDEHLKIYKYISEENNTIDIKLTSEKNKQYKGNLYEQTLNTELRIYSELGLIIMTDYGDYTHKKSIKTKLISDISLLLANNKSHIKECILTDMTLRLLLKRSKTKASKFKFSMEGLMDVDFKLAQDNTDNLLEYDSVKPFYEKYKLSSIKISMNSDIDKYITIDGNKGKLNSRSKTLDHKDIDEFMEYLSEVMKYDYLNKSYIDEIFKIAENELIMPSITKKSYVEKIYIDITKQIGNDLKDCENKDLSLILANTFFYFLIYNIDFIDNGSQNFYVEETVLRKIKKIFKIEDLTVNKLYNTIIYLASEQDDVLKSLDNYITCREVENVN